MDEAPGGDAIEGALARLYGDTKPRHWGTVMRWSLGGQDPLDGISVYERAGPVPHWHYVSYGMTDLYEKESDDPAESGWGFEFTFRLARDRADTEPSVWPANLLQNLARYVFRSGNWFEAGHHMNINGPIAAERPDTAIRGLAFVEDPELGTIETVLRTGALPSSGRADHGGVRGRAAVEHRRPVGGAVAVNAALRDRY